MRLADTLSRAHISEVDDWVEVAELSAHQNLPQWETIQQHIIARPWAKVGVDLCNMQGRTLLVVCDYVYFSGFIEVERFQSTTTASVSNALMVLFARYGVTTIVMSDNGPLFLSVEFDCLLGHGDSSTPHRHLDTPNQMGKPKMRSKRSRGYSQKCREAKVSEYQALLDCRNTPTEGVGIRPTQRFFERRCRTLMPLTEVMPRPSYDISRDAKTLLNKKPKQAYYYNQQA